MKETKNTTSKQKLYSSSSLKNEIKSIFRFAKKEHTSHKAILQSLKDRVYNVQKYKTLPNYMRADISGYIQANFDIMYDHLEWVHWYNGKFAGKKLPYGKNFKQELINQSKHVYTGTQDIY